MRLWEAGKGTALDRAVLAFTVADDPILDRELLPFDCIASAAHARMLTGIGVLTAEEGEALAGALRRAFARAEAREIDIRIEQEDGHTALEQLLTEEVGEAGRKIHTGRSRNDQVIMALRLLVRDRLLDVAAEIEALTLDLAGAADAHRTALVPGYTHTRQAMPSTVGHLFAAVAEDLAACLGAFLVPLRMANRCALGSASGYGVPLPLDREEVARLLGLDGVDANTLYVQNTRGRLEAATLFALHQVSLCLSRFAADLIWGSSEPFGFFRLPLELTTGSSIMPQKRNPDVLELVRTTPASLLGAYTTVTGLLHGMTAGYHRDLQRTKSPLLRGLDEARAAVTIVRHAVTRLEVDAERCQAALAPEIFATDRAYAQVRAGKPFRDAYRAVKDEVPARLSPPEILAPRTHTGAPGTDHTPAIRARLAEGVDALAPFRKGAAVARRLVAPE